MSKLLKPLIIAMLVLSIGALVLGTLLYQKREIVKGRTQKLQDSVATIAQNLEYKRLNKDSLKNLDSMGTELGALTAAAKEKQNELVATIETLDQTKTTLASTEETLETTKTELRQSEDQVAALEEDVAAKQSEISRKETQIAGLEEETANLSDEVSKLENEYTLAQAELDDLNAEYMNLEEAYKEIIRTQTANNTNGDTPGILPIVDVEGKVLVVNPEWNFVIIDKGSEDELRENVILLVHRGSEPIGKVRISLVQDSIAIAEIVSSWDDATPVEGDDVISPQAPS